jgi:hypothetical protein
MALRALIVAAFCTVAMIRAGDAQPLHVLAAGSLREALGEIGRQYRALTGIEIVAGFGPSGLLRQRIEQGEHADLLTTGGSKSLMASGTAILEAAEKVIEKRRELAAHALEAATADIELVNGRFVIAGTDRSIDLIELARLIRTELTLRDAAAAAPSPDSMRQFWPPSRPDATQPRCSWRQMHGGRPAAHRVTLPAYGPHPRRSRGFDNDLPIRYIYMDIAYREDETWMSRCRVAAGRAGGDRRRPGRRPGIFRAADGVDRNEAGHVGGARRDFRAGRVRDPVRRR